MRFGTDGVRGRAYDELSIAFARRLGSAAAAVIGSGEWLIGRDPRESGPDLVAAFAAGLRDGGGDPIDVGMVPTPALAWASVRRQLPAAMVTASHNPWHDNGIKIFAAGGRKLSDDVETAIEYELDRAGVADDAPSGATPPDPYRRRDSIAAEYAASLVASGGALAGMRIVLDCANGAMSHVAPDVFRTIGADVTVVHDQPNGRNINERCGATHPVSLVEAVVAARADLGVAFDGDGDRLIAVDERGRVVDGDRLIGLAAVQLRDSGRLRHDTVVVTVMSNLGFHRAMAAHGIAVVTTAVGDRYVLQAQEAHGYSLGGEQSGHIIYRDLATTGDGLLAAVQLAAYVRGQPLSFSELASGIMTSYPQVLVNVTVADRHPDAASELAAEIANAEAQLGGDGRVLVRASGTEPMVRVMVEASTPAQAQAIADDVAAVVRMRWA
jgi:phosphoglucosamine mutase